MVQCEEEDKGVRQEEEKVTGLSNSDSRMRDIAGRSSVATYYTNYMNSISHLAWFPGHCLHRIRNTLSDHRKWAVRFYIM